MNRATVWAGLALATVPACTREPLADCPTLTSGELVVTEVRSDDDEVNGSWIELFNASGRPLDLAGLRVRFRKLDGSSEIAVLVRRALDVAAGDYVVLGRYLDGMGPAHVDYGFRDDFDTTWLSAAAIDVEACGAQVDRARYDALPTSGTFSLGVPPDAESNDLPTSWCVDPIVGGSPGAANPPCP